MRVLAGSALVGVASGLRSTAGLGVVIARGSPKLPPALRRPAARPTAAAAIATELVIDKMPFTGSRLDPPGLIGRVAFAGLGAALLTRTARRSGGANVVTAAAVAIASASALLAAKAGHDWRAALAKERPDLAIALAEDAIAIALALSGATLAAGR